MDANEHGFAEEPVVVRPLDEEQARLVAILRAAGGRTVSYERLHALGVENPATLAYELEIAGLEITHVRRPLRGGEAVHPGIRLEDAPATAESNGSERGDLAAPPARRDRPAPLRPRISREHAAGAGRSIRRAAGRIAPRSARRGGSRAGAAAPPAAETERARSRAAAGRIASRERRLIGGVAALLALCAAAGVLAASFGGSHGSPGGARARTSELSQSGGSPRRGAARQTPTGSAGASRRGAAARRSAVERTRSTTSAATLQAEGHRLLESGDYRAALGDLRAAVQASGQSSQGCAAAATSACLTYAYALYDLGRALALDDDPAAAVTVLRERLQIDNQRPVVREELALARDRLDGRTPAPNASRPSVRAGRGSRGDGRHGAHPQAAAPRGAAPVGGAGSPQHVSASGGLQAPSGGGAAG